MSLGPMRGGFQRNRYPSLRRKCQSNPRATFLLAKEPDGTLAICMRCVVCFERVHSLRSTRPSYAQQKSVVRLLTLRYLFLCWGLSKASDPGSQWPLQGLHHASEWRPRQESAHLGDRDPTLEAKRSLEFPKLIFGNGVGCRGQKQIRCYLGNNVSTLLLDGGRRLTWGSWGLSRVALSNPGRDNRHGNGITYSTAGWNPVLGP